MDKELLKNDLYEILKKNNYDQLKDDIYDLLKEYDINSYDVFKLRYILGELDKALSDITKHLLYHD